MNKFWIFVLVFGLTAPVAAQDTTLSVWGKNVVADCEKQYGPSNIENCIKYKENGVLLITAPTMAEDEMKPAVMQLPAPPYVYVTKGKGGIVLEAHDNRKGQPLIKADIVVGEPTMCLLAQGDHCMIAGTKLTIE